MYCPRCGQKQATQDVRFCSRCGFPLTEVIGLLERGGEPATPPQKTEASPGRRGIRQGLLLFAVSLALCFVMSAAGAHEDAVILLFLLGSFAAFVRVIYGFAKHMRACRRSRNRLPESAPGLLAPAHTAPVAVPRGQFDTGEIVVEPPSVTEHTTRHLEQ